MPVKVVALTICDSKQRLPLFVIRLRYKIFLKIGQRLLKCARFTFFGKPYRVGFLKKIAVLNYCLQLYHTIFHKCSTFKAVSVGFFVFTAFNAFKILFFEKST